MAIDVAREQSGVEAGAREFLRSNAIVLALVALAGLLTYGLALTTVSLSIDDEVRLLTTDPAAIWIEQGRPVVALLKLIMGNWAPVAFFDLALALVFLFIAGVMWAMLFARAARPRGVSRAGLLMFLVVFTTLPVQAYYLTFDVQNVEMSLAFIWTAAGAWCVWLAVVEQRGRLLAIAAVVFSVLAVLTFQSFIFALVAGVLVAQLARMLSGDAAPGTGSPRTAIKETTLLLAPAVLAMALAAVLHLLFVERGGHVEGYIAWGALDVVAVIRRLGGWASTYAIGSGFFGGWVLLPTVAAAAVLFFLTVRTGLRRRQWYPAFLLLLIFAMPVALAVALGTPLPNRAMQALPLVAASVWLLLGLVVPAKRSIMAAVVVGATVFTIWNAGVTTRLFLSEHHAFQTDRTIAGQISERLGEAGWDGQRLSIVVIGQRALGPLEQLAADETFGASFFNWDNGVRASVFMRVNGYPLFPPTNPQRVAASARAESMPSWPERGSVVLEDGVAVVKFADP